MNSKPGPAALISPSAARNRDPILAVLRRELPGRGTVVEVASGSGEHAVYMAAALAGILWQPTDRDPEALASIAAHRQAAGLANLLPPLRLEAAAPSWPVETADAIVAVNMIHIAPWRAAEGLMAGAGRILPPAGALILYGPFAEAGRELAPSNVAFDEGLRLRNPEWGLREIGQVGAEAARHGLTLAARHEMPANNLTLVFRRPAGG